MEYALTKQDLAELCQTVYDSKSENLEEIIPNFLQGKQELIEIASGKVVGEEGALLREFSIGENSTSGVGSKLSSYEGENIKVFIIKV